MYRLVKLFSFVFRWGCVSFKVLRAFLWAQLSPFKVCGARRGLLSFRRVADYVCDY